MQAFHWSVRDIDETDIESLLPFIRQLTGVKEKPKVHGDVTFLDKI